VCSFARVLAFRLYPLLAPRLPNIEVTRDDPQEIDRAAAQIHVQASRYPKELERRTGL
jgi:hypothetical protein